MKKGETIIMASTSTKTSDIVHIKPIESIEDHH